MSTARYGFDTVPTNSTNPSVPVNDFMRLIDALLDTVVEDMSLTAPPSTTESDVGLVWIPAATASGDWAGHENELALCVGEDQWLFIDPPEGKRVRNSDDGKDYGYSGSAWSEVASGGSDVLDVETPSNASGTVTLDFDSKSRYVGAITLAANVTTLTISNLPGSGKFAEYELHIKQDGTGSRTFAIPASHKALGGSDTAIASAANAVTVLTASTVDNGTTWRYAMQESA